MKKFVLLIGCLAIYIAANAQWSNGSADNTLISPVGSDGNTLPRSAKTSDDMTYISWNSSSIEFHISLQLVDKSGKAMWKDGGILVSSHKAPTWTTDYDLAVTPDNCAILAFSDGRSFESGNGFQPFVYKINKSGELVWGANGVKIPYENKGGTRPQVCVTQKGNVIVGFGDVDGQCITLAKLSPEGNVLWSGLTIPFGAMCNLIASGEDNFIVAYYLALGASGTNLMARKYDANGEAIWKEAVGVDVSGVIDSRIEFESVSDGANGVVLLYKANYSTSEMYTKLQRVSSDGKLLMNPDGVYASSIQGVHNAGRLDVDVQRGEIFVMEKYNNSQLIVNKFNMFGEFQWDENGFAFVEEDSWGYVPCSSSHIGDGSTILIYAQKTGDIPTKNLLLAARIGADGVAIWDKQFICDAQGTRSWVVCSPFFNNQVCAFWADTRNVVDKYGYGQIYGQNINIDGILGVTVANDKIKNHSGIRIYPNPAKDFISIACESGQIENITVNDLSGRTVLNIPHYVENINVQGLKSGIYILNAKTSNGNFKNKVIIK